jgi:hypothetical protein
MSTEIDTEATEAEPSLRDLIDAAYEKTATDEAAEQTEPAQRAEQTETAAETAARERDAQGRFAPKSTTGSEQEQNSQAQQGTQGQQAGQEGAQGTGAQQAADVKPPASWNPLAREKWAGVDPEIRNEVHRREREMQTVLQQGAQARNFIQSFENVVRPYEVFIRQENSNPLQAVQNLMQTAATLRVGTPQDKVSMIAGMIQNFGVDIAQLDSALAAHLNGSGTGNHTQANQGAFRDARLDQFLAQQARKDQEAQQQQQGVLQQQIAAFASSHEFYNDVGGLMADLMEVKARQGIALDMEAAYKQACQMHDGVAKTLATRNASANNANQKSAVLRAKRAAASVKGESSPHDGGTVPKNDSVRASIEAAIESLSQ